MKWLAVIVATLLSTGGIGTPQPGLRGMKPVATVSPTQKPETKYEPEKFPSVQPTLKYVEPVVSPTPTLGVKPTGILKLVIPSPVLIEEPMPIGPTGFECPPPLIVGSPTKDELVCLDKADPPGMPI